MQANIAIVELDEREFIGAQLRFPFPALHPISEIPLREWVAQLPGAQWNKQRRIWTIAELADLPRGTLTSAGFVVRHPDGSQARPSDFPAYPPRLKPSLPDPLAIPDWFGLELWEYQRSGALAVANGRRLLADAPGVGKTRTALAAASALGSRRTLVVCPQVVTTHWTNEAIESGLGEHSGTMAGLVGLAGNQVGPGALPDLNDLVPPESAQKGNNTPSPTHTSVTTQVLHIKTGGRPKPFPDAGVIVVGAHLIAARPALTAQLRAWRPTVFICDEAHLAKTWGSLRSRILRRLARTAAVTIPTTGTPILASPLEVAPLLDMVGILGPEFGSFMEFRDHFAKQGKWGWYPNKRRLPELRRTVEGSWVRRTKEDVLSYLPPKSRRTLWTDIDSASYQMALDTVNGQIDEWVDMVIEATGELPSTQDCEEWADTQRAMVARLRQAAGLAKVPAAATWIVEWAEESAPENQGQPCKHPLVVWVHHHSVTAALLVHLAKSPRLADRVAVIDGGTDSADRDAIIERFGAGGIAVLICSIHAAGVGITLTRANEALFVETDWTPAIVVQAEDRLHRIGQTEPVTYTTLVAAGTVDERVHTVLSAKSRTVSSLMDGDFSVAATTERVFAGQLVRQLVAERVRLRRRALTKQRRRSPGEAA